MIQFLWDVGTIWLAVVPIVLWVSGCFWAVLWLTRGSDEIGGKTAARILAAPAVLVVGFFGIASLPAYGLLAYPMMAWVTMLLAPLIAFVYFAPGTVDSLERHVVFRRIAKG